MRELPSIFSENCDTSNEKITPMGEYLLYVVVFQLCNTALFLEVTDGEGDKGACYIPPDTTTGSWRDYLVTQLHPRSLNFIPRSVEMGFPLSNSFCMGALCMENVEFSQFTEDKLHFFVEDCDNLQGNTTFI